MIPAGGAAHLSVLSAQVTPGFGVGERMRSGGEEERKEERVAAGEGGGGVGGVRLTSLLSEMESGIVCAKHQ